MNHITIIATSEEGSSKSQRLARTAEAALRERGVATTLLDLREQPAPERIEAALQQATKVIFAVPIYNFDVNARAKQVIEEQGSALEGKTVGLICQAGGHRSYMSVLGFANSLMLDFRCWIVPRFVYAVGSDFHDDAPGAEVVRRIEELVETLLRGTE